MTFEFTIDYEMPFLPLSESREGELVEVGGGFTQAATDGGGAIATGLSKLVSYNAIGNVVDKPIDASDSGGTLTLNASATAGPTGGKWSAKGYR
ncbi:MAG: hypothetical protein V3U54_13015 [Thermodesulfobacteriota bacterium]